MTQFPMNDVAALGLLKIDFLGLRNLDVIDKALELVGEVTLDDIPIDDARDVRDARARRRDGRLPVRVVGDARRAAPGEADGVRRPDRARRALPARTDVVHPRLRPAQERAGAGHVHRPAPRGDHLHEPYGICIYQEHLPRDREADRRLHAGGGGRPAQGDRQEDPFADGVAEGEVPRGLRAERHDARGREAALEGHGAVAGLLLQQGARRVLRADRVPHRVAARAPPARVHGGAHLVGDEHEGPRALLRQRVSRDGDRGAAAGRQLLAVRLRRRRGEDPLRPQRREERRRQRGSRDRRRAREGRAVRVDLGVHRARRSGRGEQARARVARQVRRVRFHRRVAQGDVRRARERALLRAAHARRSAHGPGLALRRPRRAAVASADRRRTSGTRTSCCGSRRRRSGSTSPSIRSPPSATSCAARPSSRSPSSSAAATATSSRSAASSPRSSR